jgi:DNA-binding protein HU-beta
MNKAELIDAIASEAGITKAQAKKALESMTDSVASTLAGGGRVSLVGFGTFSVSKRAAQKAATHRLAKPSALLLKMLLNLSQVLN